MLSCRSWGPTRVTDLGCGQGEFVRVVDVEALEFDLVLQEPCSYLLRSHAVLT